MVIASSVVDASWTTRRSSRVRVVCVNRGRWFLQDVVLVMNERVWEFLLDETSSWTPLLNLPPCKIYLINIVSSLTIETMTSM